MQTPEEQEQELSRSDMQLVRQAVRQDWPIPPDVQKKILQRLVDYLDRDHMEGQTATDRVVIAAARTIASFGSLALKQQQLDLAREKAEGRSNDLSVADLVREAERRAEEREHERAGEGRRGDRDPEVPGA